MSTNGSIMKKLLGESAVYGLSSIVGRFLNWMLVPVYTRVLVRTSDYGIVTNLYGWTALMLVILTYGMETGFFRFINREPDPKRVYGTILTSLASTSTLFVLAVALFLKPVSAAMGYSEYSEFVMMLAVIVAMDAFSAVPFANLRHKQKAFRFAGIKLASIAINIGLNLFFLIAAPWLSKNGFSAVNLIWSPGLEIRYVFVSNVVSSAFILLALSPDFLFRWSFDAKLMKRIFTYSFPILLFGIAGIFNQTADKILFPYLFSDPAEANSQLGIYGACFKISVVMVMSLQAFRYAYEPFAFRYKKGDDTSIYVDVMHFFLLFSLFVFLGITFYLDIFKHLIGSAYFAGLAVVPIVMLGELFFGVYSNLSIWYKLTDRTKWGSYFSLVACVITVLIIVIFVPRFGFMACAWASFFSNFVVMVASYVIGQKYFPIAYRIGSGVFYFALAMILWCAAAFVPIENEVIYLAFKTALLIVFAVIVVLKEPLLRSGLLAVKKKLLGGR
jgi:O-antigen/teichoic acid export membrane protein